VSEQQLREIFGLLRPASGVDFRHYKLPTIRRRLFRRMALQRLTNVHLQTELNRAINDRFAPSGVVVDSDLQIVQFRGQTGPYHGTPGGLVLLTATQAMDGAPTSR